VMVGKHELIFVDERVPRSRAGLNETVPGFQALEKAEG
jgi:hypothetical protein